MQDFNLTWEWFGGFWPADKKRGRGVKRPRPYVLVTPKVMNIFRDEKLIERAAAMAPAFADAMHGLADAPGVVDVRSIGLMAGIEVAPVGGVGARGHALQKALYEQGLHLKNTGDTLIVAPAFIAEPKHIDEIVTKLRKALAAVG